MLGENNIHLPSCCENVQVTIQRASFPSNVIMKNLTCRSNKTDLEEEKGWQTISHVYVSLIAK